MMFGSSDCEQDYIDEYVVGMQNPGQLVSSLAFMLKERNYTGLYDTSILSSPESHLKKSSLEELNRDFLYKWYLFFKGITINVTSYSKLIIIPEVAEEMYNLASATLSSIEKKKNQYKSLSPHERTNLQDTFEQILNNEQTLQNLQQALEKYRQNSTPIAQPVFDNLLELIKLLNVTLELKKPSSRESNDTDERVAARTFYEILSNDSNVAVYTRDDDIRKLISATFKFLLSKDISEAQNFLFLKNLSHLNIVILKYNKEKRVYSRFFESSTLAYFGDFHFPRKLSKGKINQIFSTTWEILGKIREQLEKLQESRSLNEEKRQEIEPVSPKELARHALEEIFKSVSQRDGEEDIKTYHFKTAVMENLSVLAQYLEYNELEERIAENSQKYQRAYLESVIQQLKHEKETLQKKFDDLSSQQNQRIEDWQQIQNVVQEIRENLLKLNFFENALRNNLSKVSYEDYESFKRLLAKFRQNGFDINEKETPVPPEKLAEITERSIGKTIETIEHYHLKHQRTHVYMTQDHLLLFLLG